jgi:hypothetical protein
MNIAELLQLRDRLVIQRRALLDRLATDVKGGPDRIVEPGFLRLLADTHTAIAAVDAERAEADGPEWVP